MSNIYLAELARLPLLQHHQVIHDGLVKYVLKWCDVILKKLIKDTAECTFNSNALDTNHKIYLKIKFSDDGYFSQEQMS